MTQRPAAPPPPKVTRGTVDALPCPWCRRPNDMTEEVQQEGWGGGMKADVLQPDNLYNCDHCKRLFKVDRIQNVMLLWAKPVAGRM